MSRTKGMLFSQFVTQTTRYSNIRSMLHESYRSLDESLLFLAQEVSYAKLACLQNPSFKSISTKELEIRLVTIEKLLDQTRIHLDSVFASVVSRQRPATMTNKAFALFIAKVRLSMVHASRALQDASNAEVYSRYRHLTPESMNKPRMPQSRARLSEIHLDYPDTFRAISNVLSDYFGKLSTHYCKGLVREEIVRPMLVLARGENYQFESFSWAPSVPLFLVKQKKFYGKIASGDLKGMHEDFGADKLLLGQLLHCFRSEMHLGRVVCPRYFPTMIRYLPLMCHELMHPIIRLVSMMDVIGISPESDRVPSRMRRLRFVRGVLQVALNKFLNEQGRLGTLFLESYSRRLNKYEYYLLHGGAEGNLLTKTAEYHSNEILADACALLITKESYIYSLMFHLGVDARSDYLGSQRPRELVDKIIDDNFSDPHPPSVVRIYFLIHLLRSIGLPRAADRAENQMDRFLDGSPMKAGYEAAWKFWQDWWLSTGEALLGGLISDSIESQASHSPLYCAMRIKDKSSKYGYAFNEEKLELAQSVISNRILTNRIIWDAPLEIKRELEIAVDISLPDDFVIQPSDVIGAMWYRILHENVPLTLRQRLQWRLCLSKNF
jgi:hypothetical protein